MVTLYRSQREIKLDGVKCVLRVTGDGDVLRVTLSPEAGTLYGDTPSVSVDIAYNGEVISFVDEELDASAEFVLTDAREVTLSSQKLVVAGENCKSFTLSWNESAGSENVEISYSIDRIKELYTSKITVTASAREGLSVRPIELSCTHTARGGSSHTRKCTLTHVDDDTYVYENPMSDVLVGAGARMQYRIEFACYADEESAEADCGEHFIGYSAVTTPNFIISPHHGESSPFGLLYHSPVAGAKVRVSWRALPDAVTFTLERSCDGGEFVRVYEGGDTYFADTVPREATTVGYRVKAMSSSWWYGESEMVGCSNLYIGTSRGIRAAVGLYVGYGGAVREIHPIMSVGGMK